MPRKKKDPRAMDRHVRPSFLVRPAEDELAAWRAYAERVGKPLGDVIREAMARALKGKP